MARKQDPIVELTEILRTLFSDPVGNYDAIHDALREHQDWLVDIRDGAQARLEWMTALQHALQLNKIDAMVKKEKERQEAA